MPAQSTRPDTRPDLDKTARQHVIARSIWIAVPATLAVVAIAYRLVPPIGGLDEPAARLALAARWLVVAMLPYVAMCLSILVIRFLEGAHDPTRGLESENLRIHCRAMQNTLEQLVWFAICIFAIASAMAPNEAHLVPVVCVVFLFARLAYWWGYLRLGTLGRAPGVQITFTLNISLLILALVLLARTL